MFLRALLLAALTLAAYASMLSSPFKTQDDQFSIVSNPVVKNFSLWPTLFEQGYFNDHSYYRPLSSLSFVGEARLFGLNPFFYNLDNVLLHIINAFLVWWAVSILVNGEVGFWTALLFALHPFQWEAVANISGRPILLSTTFSLLSLIAYFRSQPALALLAFIPALLCKESAGIVPAIIFMYALINRQNLKALWPWALIVAAYIGLRHYLGITQLFSWPSPGQAGLGFLTFLRSVLTDLRLFVLPVDLHFDRSMALFHYFAEPQAVITMIVYLALGAALVIFRSKISPLHWLALAWFALALLPVSQLVMSIGVGPGRISTAEHFLYFACIPVFMAAVQGLLRLKSTLLSIFSIAFISFFFLITIEQNIYASNELSMMERSLKIQPQNSRLQYSVGLIYAQRGKFAEAHEHFAQAVANDPLNPRYAIALGKSLCDLGRVQECLNVYNEIPDPGEFHKLLDDNRRAAQRLLAATKP